MFKVAGRNPVARSRTRSSHPWALGQPFPTADGPGPGNRIPPSGVGLKFVENQGVQLQRRF